MKQHKLPWPYIAAAETAMKKSEQEVLSETMSFVGSLSFFPSHSRSQSDRQAGPKRSGNVHNRA